MEKDRRKNHKRGNMQYKESDYTGHYGNFDLPSFCGNPDTYLLNAHTQTDTDGADSGIKIIDKADAVSLPFIAL